MIDIADKAMADLEVHVTHIAVREGLGNGNFGPPYVWSNDAKMLAFAVSPLDFDPHNVHCYPVGFSGNPIDAPFDANMTSKPDTGRETGSSVWFVKGAAADWYLAPVVDGYAFTNALYVAFRCTLLLFSTRRHCIQGPC